MTTTQRFTLRAAALGLIAALGAASTGTEDHVAIAIPVPDGIPAKQ